MSAFVDWRQQPSMVKCHVCGAIRNNYQPKPEARPVILTTYATGAPYNDPISCIGWYSHISDELIWCCVCWIKKGFRKYHGKT